jgi:uncharacterized repeat protein (TIGR01451 family)
MRTRTKTLGACAALALALGAGGARAALRTYSNPAQFSFGGTTSSSTIALAGVNGTILDAQVRLNGAAVQFFANGLEDVDFLLVSPTGEEIILMSFACDATAGPVTLQFASSGSLLPSGVSGLSCVSGIFQASDYSNLVGGYVLDSPPAPAPPYPGTLANLVGDNPNGTWTLYAEEFGGNQGGVLATGWDLLLLMPDEANLAVSHAASPPQFPPGGGATLTAIVANGGPDAAQGVSLAESIPAGLTLTGASVDVGGPCAPTAGAGPLLVTCPIGTLASGAAATASFAVTGSALGSYPVVATATSSTPDPAPGDETATATVVVVDLPTLLEIPTLDGAGLAALAALLALAGAFAVGRRRRA